MTTPPLPTVIVAYLVDGQWHVQRMHVMAVVVVCAPPSRQRAVRRRKKRSPPPRCPSSRSLAGMLESLCACGSEQTLRVERNLHVQLAHIPLLSACRVDSGEGERERFGKLAHWAALVETTGCPNIVLYICSEGRFFVVCRKSINTQPVNTRSAICWLRDAAGLGFCVHDARGVFRIVVTRRDSVDDPWSECLDELLASVADVFPTSSFDDES